MMKCFGLPKIIRVVASVFLNTPPKIFSYRISILCRTAGKRTTVLPNKNQFEQTADSNIILIYQVFLA